MHTDSHTYTYIYENITSVHEYTYTENKLLIMESKIEKEKSEI